MMFPFSLGCDSDQSSVSVVACNNKDHPLPITKRRRKGRMRSLRNVFSPKSSVFRSLITSFSHLFVHKEEEVEMEIGLPTDVKHVTHIGIGIGIGSTSTCTTMNMNPVKGWENLKAAENVMSFPSISVTQFELAMAAQAAGPAAI